jgi:hypothetical protein
LPTLDLRPINPVRHSVDVCPEFLEEVVVLDVGFYDGVEISRGRFGGFGCFFCILFFFRMCRCSLGNCEFAVVSGESFVWRWRYLVQAVEDPLAEGVVTLLQGFAFFGREVLVC